ncbi:hypothetical protein V8D89_015190 [Ganoderma adspersum]
MICVRGCSSLTICVGRRSTWINIPACLGRPGYPQRCAVRFPPFRHMHLTHVGEQRGCKMEAHGDSRHVVILRRGQFYWFDVLDSENRPVLTEREILRNLQAIVSDADQMPIHEVARNSIGVLSTENRKIWSSLRRALISNKNNESCLEVVDNALFVVCLDDTAPENLADLCANFLCGTYDLKNGVQVGAWHRCRRVARIYFLDARRLVASCAGRAGCVRGTKRRKCAVDYRRHTVCWRE